VLNIVVLGRACRSAANIKNRQPLGKLFVSGVDELPATFAEVVCGELNVKEVDLGAAAEEYITYIVKPQLRTLGPKYGKQLGGIRAHLGSANGTEIVNAVRTNGVYAFDVNGTTVELTEDDMLIEPVQKEGYAVETGGGFAVIIDTALTPELIEEGRVREIVSKVQTMRKEAGFEVTDHIRLTITGSDVIVALAEKYGKDFAADVLADEFAVAEPAGYVKEWDINGEKAAIGVEKL